MTLYAIILHDDGHELWEQVYQTEHDAEIVLKALIYSNLYTTGFVMPVELVTD